MEYSRHLRSKDMRVQSRERLTKRKTERHTLQFKSDQPLDNDKVDEIADIADT